VCFTEKGARDRKAPTDQLKGGREEEQASHGGQPLAVFLPLRQQRRTLRVGGEPVVGVQLVVAQRKVPRREGRGRSDQRRRAMYMC
jgi:hypothetical protein